MDRLDLTRLIGAALLGCAAAGAPAQQALEIISLRHRTVEQVLPVLQPLLEPGATLGGSRGQLFLRASPGNAAGIKRALEAIDRPSRRLQISVRFDDARESDRRRLGASGTVGTSGSRINITAQDSATRSGERVDQRLQVLEGSRAQIFSGSGFGTGFEVVPRLAGQNVLLDIYLQRDAGASLQSAATTVAARLGEWVELGGTASAATRDERAIASASGARASESRRIWVKVEELSN
jgi:hypothetical protein